MKLRNVESAPVEGKRVLLRVDFNVPVSEGVIQDFTRIEKSLKTIEYLMKRGSKIALISHLGRPKGKDPNLSLKPIAAKLSELLGIEVVFTDETVGNDVNETVKRLENGHVALLENLRFNKGETSNDEQFSIELSEIAEIYVNDAFGSAHRAHASTYGVAKILPSYAGFLLLEEIDALSRLLSEPERPFVVVLGGSKASEKLGILRKFAERGDEVIVGGAMCFTLLKAKGDNIGASKYEREQVERVKTVIDEFPEKILLPTDIIGAKDMDKLSRPKVYRIKEIPNQVMGLDIGPETTDLFCNTVKKAETIFWNGPMGVFENSDYEKGTKAIALAIADSEAVSVAGGGETINAIEKYGVEKSFDHISTGGGASLEFVEKGTLPALELLIER